MKELEQEFVEFIINIARHWGLDSLSSRLFALLYIQPDEISIEDLSTKSGYSLASVSNKMRILESTGMALRIKKPKSKKVYYSVDKDVIRMMERKLDKVKEIEINYAKQKIPQMIDKYKKKNLNNEERKQLKILNNYYKQTLLSEKMLEEFSKILKKLRDIK